MEHKRECGLKDHPQKLERYKAGLVNNMRSTANRTDIRDYVIDTNKLLRAMCWELCERDPDELVKAHIEAKLNETKED